MRISGLSRCAFGICAAAAMLAGCGGSQPPIGTPGTMPQSGAVVAHADRSGSWMLPEARSEDLLYVSSDRGLFAFSYPRLKEVGQLAVGGGFGLCSDANGNIFAPSFDNGYPVIYEYAHGGTNPIETVSEYGDDRPSGCSIDPTTGNLAVTNNVGNDYFHCEGGGNVAIFADAQGKPTTYCTGPAVGYAVSCGYDNSGNLYVDGTPSDESLDIVLAELPEGGNSFDSITLDDHLKYPGSIQWDGSFITIETEQRRPRIFEVQITGSRGKIVHTTDFGNTRHARFSWIQGDRVVLPAGDPANGATTKVGLWPYPAGGSAILRLSPHERDLWGVTVSVAPR
jgi:hypothetical protein